jgi:hypothetical protein
MKCFRVREIGEVETGLKFQVLDQMGYVPTGGTALPYLRVDPALHKGERIGVIETASLVQSLSTRGLILTPVKAAVAVESESDSGEPQPQCYDIEDGAIVVLPSGAYNFEVGRDHVPYGADSRSALTVVIGKGETIRAFRNVKSLSEPMVSACLHFDGEKVTFC